MYLKKLNYQLMVLVGLLCYGYSAKSQNLIPNFSFEEHILCPPDIYFGKTKWPIVGWFNVNSGTPDYFHRCSDGKVSVPGTWAGSASPVHGDAFIGLYLWGKRDYREYMGIALKDSLQAGVLYHFEGYYQIAEFNHYVTGSIGVAFTHKTRKELLANRVNYNPQISIRKSNPLDGNPFEWEKIAGSFIAKGGEKYIIIGNFDSKEDTSAKEIFVNAEKEMQLKNRSYAFIDHLRLWKDGTQAPDSSFQEPEIEKFILSDINFELDKYALKDTARVVLDPLVNHLNKQPKNSFILLINGYTDDIGETDYNLKLSRKRANSVARYLYKQGIPKNLLKVFGKGEASPLVPNDSEENQRRNRRVEIIINRL